MIKPSARAALRTLADEIGATTPALFAHLLVLAAVGFAVALPLLALAWGGR